MGNLAKYLAIYGAGGAGLGAFGSMAWNGMDPAKMGFWAGVGGAGGAGLGLLAAGADEDKDIDAAERSAENFGPVNWHAENIGPYAAGGVAGGLLSAGKARYDRAAQLRRRLNIVAEMGKGNLSKVDRAVKMETLEQWPKKHLTPGETFKSGLHGSLLAMVAMIGLSEIKRQIKSRSAINKVLSSK